MANSIFSVSVIKSTDRQFKEEIKDAILGNAEFKKEINKTLQQANRRIQNIEKANIASPAVKAVYAERGKKDSFTYFSTRGLNPQNSTDWELMKYEYGRALAFLNNPTSTATGARQYIKYQADELNIPFESANKIVDLATNPTIDEYGNVNIFSYHEILDRFKDDVFSTGEDIAENGEEYAKQLEETLQDAINKIDNDVDNLLDRFIDRFN